MKTKIKRHSRAVISVVLAISMLISCMMVGLIATDAARVTDSDTIGAKDDSEALGADPYYLLLGDNNNNPSAWSKYVTSSSMSFTFTPSSLGLSSFTINRNYYVAISSSSSYTNMYSQGGSTAIGTNTGSIKEAQAQGFNIGSTSYYFARFQLSAAVASVTVTVSHDNSSNKTTYAFSTTAAEPDTWTVVGGLTTDGGQTDPIFGSTWDPTLIQNDMTKSSGIYTWTKNNVTLSSASTIYYKIAKNHAWDTTVPSGSNATTVTLDGASRDTSSSKVPAGTYNISVSYDGTTLTFALTTITKSTLTVQSDIANAVVKATYNGTTVGEGQSIQNVPQGANVTISVSPDSGYKCNGITSSGGGTPSGSGNTWTLTMPANDTTVGVTLGTVNMKRIYFNNNYTQYGTVYAYVYDKDGSGNHTYEYLGARPGKIMIESDNTEMWYIDVPGDVDYVEFISGDGKSTGELTIDWNQTCPKYIPPNNYDAPTAANGGTWGNYKWGDKMGDARDNVYTVSDGSTMSASNLFTGISGTLFDYYVDHEVTSGWFKGLTQRDYDNGGVSSNDPYTKLNADLSAYADADKTSADANWANPSQPKYGITYPLYFGNLNVPAGDSLVNAYYNFVRAANNSNVDLTINRNAATGLSGNKLGDDNTIHYYKNGATNENGAPMAMFNEDFLSGENKNGETLATILRTSSFPVRKEESVKSLCLDMSSHQGNWEDANAIIVANFHNGTTTSGNLRVLMTPIGDHKYIVEIPSGYLQVEWLRFNPADDYLKATAWNNKNVGSFGTNNTYTFSSDSGNNVKGSWSTDSTLAAGHDYYEYDSTNGKDNAFITNIDTTNKTANIDYYDSASGKSVKSTENQIKGFYPFDYNNVISNSTPIASRLYLKTGGTSYWEADKAWFAAVFKVTGKNDAHLKMTYDSSLELYYVDVPEGYEKGTVDFCRMNPDYNINTGFTTNWPGKWNDSGFKDMRTDNKVVWTINNWDSSEWKSNDNITVNYKAVNDYADKTNQYAHDQGFGMKLEIPFTLNENGMNTDGTPQTFSFSGDDDLWVFVDGKLILDLGGAHARTDGFINFNTKTVVAQTTQAIGTATRNGSFSNGFNTNPNYVHTMTIYYMERGMYDSNLKFGFSFHAIPNQFWIDKKIRTKDKYNTGLYDNLNAGFFTSNNQSGDASNMTTHKLGDKTTTMSKFEKSFQDEEFTVTQWYGTNGAATANTLASGKHYTIDYDEHDHQTGDDGQYHIYHDLGNAFIGQFTTNDKFKLKETISDSNKYVYTPVFSVWDQANNDKNITFAGDNTSGYTFDFKPTTEVQGGIENTNIKARFDNYMKAHDLLLTKEITNVTDTETDFTFRILFDFTGTDQNPNYVSYPLFCDVDGVRTKLNDDGTITVKAGQIVNIFDIPQNAKIQVTEVMTDSIDSVYRYDTITIKNGDTTLDPEDEYTPITKGAQFTMLGGDMSATITNKKPDFRYTIKYTYPAYVKSYGNQSYTVSGVFSMVERETYLQLNESTGEPEFKSADLKRTFVNNMAPYEDNFQQTLSFASSTIDDNGTGKGWIKDNYTCEVVADPTDDNYVNAYFMLPYSVNSDLVPQPGGDGKVAKIKVAEQGSKNVKSFDWYVTAGKSKKSYVGDEPVFVKAPLIIYEGSTPYYFQYWSVKTQADYGIKSEEYTRCYDYEFNFSVFTNCIIEPMYNTTWAQSPGNPNPPTTYDMYSRFDPELQIEGDTTKGIKIAFLENSRNQYNNGDCGNRTTSTTAADVVYCDFLLNFNYSAGMTRYMDQADGTNSAGLVIEAVNYMDHKEDGSLDNYKDYSTVSSFNSNEVARSNAIVAWLQGGASPGGCAKAQFDANKLDNKNCIQYYYSLNNRSVSDTGLLQNTMQNRYKVFRAYAYVGNGSGSALTNVKISAPVYFTIYDAASVGLADNDTRPIGG